MIDIKLIREDPDRYIEAARVKLIDADIPALLEVDAALRDARRQLQDARTAQNAAGKRIAGLTGDEKAAAIAEMQDLKAKVKRLGEAIDDLEPKLNELMLLAAQPAAAELLQRRLRIISRRYWSRA